MSLRRMKCGLPSSGRTEKLTRQRRRTVWVCFTGKQKRTHTHVRICLCFLVFNMSWEALSAPPAVSDLRRGRAQFIKNGSRSQ